MSVNSKILLRNRLKTISVTSFEIIVSTILRRTLLKPHHFPSFHLVPVMNQGHSLVSCWRGRGHTWQCSAIQMWSMMLTGDLTSGLFSEGRAVVVRVLQPVEPGQPRVQAHLLQVAPPPGGHQAGQPRLRSGQVILQIWINMQPITYTWTWPFKSSWSGLTLLSMAMVWGFFQRNT